MLTRSRSQSREESVPVLDSQSSSGYSSSSQSQSQEDSAPKDECIPKRKKTRGRGPPVHPDQWICIMPGSQNNTVPPLSHLQIVRFQHNFFSSDKVCIGSKTGHISVDSALSFATLRDPKSGMFLHATTVQHLCIKCFQHRLS